MVAHEAGADEITIEVKLFADLRRFLPKGYDGSLSFTLPAGTTVQQVIDKIGVPASDEVITGINGELGHRDDVLHDGDEVLFLSPMEGG